MGVTPDQNDPNPKTEFLLYFSGVLLEINREHCSNTGLRHGVLIGTLLVDYQDPIRSSGLCGFFRGSVSQKRSKLYCIGSRALSFGSFLRKFDLVGSDRYQLFRDVSDLPFLYFFK